MQRKMHRGCNCNNILDVFLELVNYAWLLGCWGSFEHGLSLDQQLFGLDSRLANTLTACCFYRTTGCRVIYACIVAIGQVTNLPSQYHLRKKRKDLHISFIISNFAAQNFTHYYI